MFRFKRSVPVGYDLQGYIYFYSRMYRFMTLQEQQRLQSVCKAAGGDHAGAVMEFVTTDAGAAFVCRKHYLSQSTLERAVRRYYVLFAAELTG